MFFEFHPKKEIRNTENPFRRKFRSKTSDYMGQMEKAEVRAIREEQESQERRCRCAQRHCVFPIICGPGGSKSRLAKAADAEPSGKMRDEKLHAVVARSNIFEVKNVQKTHTMFGS